MNVITNHTRFNEAHKALEAAVIEYEKATATEKTAFAAAYAAQKVATEHRWAVSAAKEKLRDCYGVIAQEFDLPDIEPEDED